MLSLSSRSSSSMLKLLSNLLMVASKLASVWRESAWSAKNWSSSQEERTTNNHRMKILGGWMNKAWFSKVYSLSIPVRVSQRGGCGDGCFVPSWSASFSLARRPARSERRARPSSPAPWRGAPASCSVWNASSAEEEKKGQKHICLFHFQVFRGLVIAEL